MAGRDLPLQLRSEDLRNGIVVDVFYRVIESVVVGSRHPLTVAVATTRTHSHAAMRAHADVSALVRYRYAGIQEDRVGFSRGR